MCVPVEISMWISPLQTSSVVAPVGPSGERPAACTWRPPPSCSSSSRKLLMRPRTTSTPCSMRNLQPATPRAPSGHGGGLRNEVTEGELSTILDRNTWSGVTVGQLSLIIKAWHWA